VLSFLVLIPIILFLLYLGLIFESTGLLLLGFAAALFGVLSFFVLLWLRTKVRVELRIPIRMAEIDQPFGIQYEIHNDAFIPLKKISVGLKYSELRSRKWESARQVLRDVPKGTSMKAGRLRVGRAGYFEFLTAKTRVYDPFGIFSMSLKKKGIAHAMVLPRIEEVPVRLGEAVKHFYGEAMTYDELSPGHDPSEIFDVREFRDGDKLQRVHWKLSARMDELMVKENALPKTCPILIFMPEGDLEAQGILDYVTSLSFTLMDLKCGHYVIWHSVSRNDLLRVRVDDEESFYFAITAYLQDGAAGSPYDRLERYREKYRGEPFLHGIVADGEGRISLDGEPFEKVKDLPGELLLK